MLSVTLATLAATGVLDEATARRVWDKLGGKAIPESAPNEKFDVCLKAIREALDSPKP